MVTASLGLPEFLPKFTAFMFYRENMVYSVLLFAIIFYWLLVVIGAFDIDLFDIDVDTDMEVDDGPWFGFLRFLNVGEVPVMVVVSFLIICLWICAMFTSFFLGPKLAPFFRVALFIPNFILSLFFAKWISMPFKKVFHALNNQDEKITIVGNYAISKNNLEPGQKGQADVKKSGAPITINVILSQGSEPVKKGSELVVLQESEKDGFYDVQKLNLKED